MSRDLLVDQELAARGWHVRGPRRRGNLYCATAHDGRGTRAIYAASLRELRERIDAYARRAA